MWRFRWRRAAGSSADCASPRCRQSGPGRSRWCSGSGSWLRSSRMPSPARRAEEALRASELMKSAILASLTSGVAVLDQGGGIVAVNESWARLAQGDGSWGTQGEVDSSYLDVCDRAAREGLSPRRGGAGRHRGGADEVAGGLRARIPVAGPDRGALGGDVRRAPGLGRGRRRRLAHRHHRAQAAPSWTPSGAARSWPTSPACPRWES